jgi:hypothetical protein
VAVVPADERDGREAAGQVLAGDAHAPVGLGPDGVDDLVVEALEVAVVQVDPVGDVATEPDPRVGQGPLQHPGDRLDRLVVGRDPVADQSERGREAVEDVDGQDQVGAVEQRLGGVQPGRPGADDRHPQRAGAGAELRHRASSTAAGGALEGAGRSG